MLTPLEHFAFDFTADANSTVFSVDLTLPPVSLDLRGSQATGVVQLEVTGAANAAVSGVSATITGTLLTLTFTTAPPRLDQTSELIMYGVTGWLELQPAQTPPPSQ